MENWLKILVTFAGGALVAIFGNLLIPWLRDYQKRPKLKIIAEENWVLSQNRERIYHRLLVVNKGKTVARKCVPVIRIKNATKENILEDTSSFKPILKPDDFSYNRLLKDSHRLCWAVYPNSTDVSMTPGVPYEVDILAFDYSQQANPKNPPPVKHIVIPSEIGWDSPRVVLKPERYVLFVQVHGENCQPSKEIRFWVRKIHVDQDYLEVSFQP